MGARRSDGYPLRRVLERRLVRVGFTDGTGFPIPQDVLECGHMLSPAQDAFGERCPERRRCFKCAKGLPPDVTTAPA